MNWVKENKFLTGFLAVLLIGVGALGYEVYSASNAYDEAVNQYTTKSSEYNRLRHLTPYPNKKVLDALGVQKTEAAGSHHRVSSGPRQAGVSARSLHHPGAVSGYSQGVGLRCAGECCGSRHVALPAKFFLGFDTYEGRPPASEAAAPLGRQLKAIEWVVNQLIASKITELMD
jgi:hypothetical protein